MGSWDFRQPGYLFTVHQVLNLWKKWATKFHSVKSNGIGSLWVQLYTPRSTAGWELRYLLPCFRY